MASNTVPWLQLPSPPKATLTLPSRRELAGNGGAHRQRRAAADDGIGAQHALGEVSDVHRAALALAQAILAAVDLLHHPDHVTALGDAVAMTAMGAGDVVCIGERRAHTDRDRLLSGIEVRKAGNLTGRDLDVQPLLELADGLHSR